MVNGQRSKSHMWLVDLAGSERVGKTEVEGERLKESQFINKSLSALGDVISALASILLFCLWYLNYLLICLPTLTEILHEIDRNSKLTHLLQSSLGGDCKTLMFTLISPSSADHGETLCSLNFASRVRGIEYGPARKQSDPAESFKLKQMAEKLRQEEKETARLNDSPQLMQLKYASRENVFKTLHEKVRDLENQLSDHKKSKTQVVRARDSSKFTKPPLAPIRERQPLSRITNRLPPPRRSTINKMPGFQNRENIPETKTFSKARRISLSPVVRSIPVQPKRRASIAILPTQTEKQKYPIRKSLAGFPAVPHTPLPDGKGSRFSSPPNMNAVWRSRIPPLFGSPRQRASPSSSMNPNTTSMNSMSPSSSMNSNTSSMNKLCFSVQKRLIVGSPAAQPRSSSLYNSIVASQVFRDRELLGRFGTAQRILSKNRRQSVI